ncbi:MAG: sugar phosphate nucleotidyltransferase [Erysipelothrix sp.]
MLTKIEFEILSGVVQNRQFDEVKNALKNAYQWSHEVLDETLKNLVEKGLLVNGEYSLTQKGLDALEPYRVKKAIILAAGFGSRLVPVTLNTPKPLIKVNGVKMIESMLDSLLEVGITDITLVRGYMKEYFDVLLYKYPMLKFIDNDAYNEANNISSSVLVKDMLDHAYVAEADLMVYNHQIIRKYEYNSNYLGIKMEESDDWCIEVNNETKEVLDVHVGFKGDNNYQMVGISYWSSEEAANFESDVMEVYNKEGGKQKYWDEVALRFHKDKYSFFVRPCVESDIIEIDTFAELQEIDDAYKI